MRIRSFVPVLTLAITLCALGAAQTPAPPSPAAPAAAGKPAPPLRTADSPITPAIKDLGRHKEFLYRIQEGDVGLLFLGDSIMDFWPGRGQFSWLHYAPYNAADFGISADRTEHVLWRIENGELDGIHPKVVVLMIGTNNTGRDKPEWIAAGIQKIVQETQAKLPQTKVLLLAVFPRGLKDSPERASIAKVNTIIGKLDNGSSIRYLDLGSVFLDPAGDIPADVMPDKLHPSAKGYDLWYSTMQPLLAQMMK